MSNTKKCANCAKELVAEFKPFCSKRCADVDLHRWLNESYAIPAAEYDDTMSEDRQKIDTDKMLH